MSDLISRADALEAIKWMPVQLDSETVQRCIEAVSNLPSAQPELEEFEWCTGCKEYDQEKHCCHRWTKVIRKTVDEIKADPVRHGKWIDMDVQSYTWKVRCSVCGHERSMMSTQGEYPKYCEECGARMAEE